MRQVDSIEEVILVNNNDETTGLSEKMAAHEQGLLHRAFSVFIFNSAGELLLQRRALSKYHSAGLWTNTCCSHPRPGESNYDAAVRRLQEEMGFTVPVEKIFDFIYRADFENGLIEYEFDHVFTGEYEGEVPFNATEVSEIRYASIMEIKQLLTSLPDQFTRWFQITFPRIEQWWETKYKTTAVQ
jgi:isopentenyl-diphosphate Delta-isomerase